MSSRFGRRSVATLAAGLLAPVLSTLVSLPPASAAAAGEGPGPAMLTPHTARVSALSCYGVLDDAARPPLLLVPGTSLTPEENWEPTYLPVLLDRGHGVCLVDLPAYGTHDAQASSEYVATALRTMAARTSRRISILGYSQGALLPRVALRTWPDLAQHVDDVVGVAGVYDSGSQELASRCRGECAPVLHQLAAGSALLSSLSRRRLPTGPTFTGIGSLGDLTVTPQPAANQQPGTTSIMVQDVCPQRDLPEPDHAMIAGDAVALGLTLDALDHPGPAVAARLDPAVCEAQQYPEFDHDRWVALAEVSSSRMSASVASEPALYCRHRATCRNPRLRGFLTSAPHYTVRRTTVTVRTHALLPGRLKLVIGRRVIERLVTPGPLTLKVRRPTAGALLLVKTRPRYYTVWAAEHTRWIRPRPS